MKSRRLWSATAQQVGFDGRPMMDAALSRSEAGQSIWDRIAETARGIGAKGMALASAMGLTPKDGDALVPERMGRLEPREFAAAQTVASAARELGEREAALTGMISFSWPCRAAAQCSWPMLKHASRTSKARAGNRRQTLGRPSS